MNTVFLLAALECKRKSHAIYDCIKYYLRAHSGRLDFLSIREALVTRPDPGLLQKSTHAALELITARVR